MPHQIIDLLYEAATACPQKAALIDAAEDISFAQLRQRADAIATYIASQGLFRQPVLVLVDRDAASVVSFLGIACSGNFYVPLDVQMPLSRMQTILDTFRSSGVSILAQRKQEFTASQLASDSVTVWYLEDLLETAADETLLAKRRGALLDVDPLYMIFTSGSTGVPKGVIKSHRSILSFIKVFTETFGITQDDVLGGQAPFDFDVSAKDIYTMLYARATLVIFPKTYFSFTKKLVDAMNEYHVTTIIWAVSALSVIVKMNALEHDTFRDLKRVLFSGEILPIPHLNYWRSYLPDATFVNLYAPTEVTGNCTYYIVDRAFSEQETLPLGRCFPNIEMLVLKDDHSPALAGETGRIYIRGAFLSMGYYGNREKTDATFIQNPMHDHYPDLVYDTGDLAKCLPDGSYCFLSRQDFQIKHHGHRIELGEIETAANALAQVRACAAIYDKEHQRIVLFAEGEELSARYLLTGLRKMIPKYMLPEKFVFLDAIPLNKNMKIDRQYLLAQAVQLPL